MHYTMIKTPPKMAVKNEVVIILPGVEKMKARFPAEGRKGTCGNGSVSLGMAFKSFFDNQSNKPSLQI